MGNSSGGPGPAHLARRAAAGAIGVVVAVLLFEAGARALALRGRIASPPPQVSEAQRFWDGAHPEFGVWRRANAQTRLDGGCYRAHYRSNSLGARDRERDPAAAGPRVLVLGDSFAEGWGVARERRFSDRLEARTGVEHANLAMAHFGPYQSLLVYRAFAPRLEHERVLLAVVPHNDFWDLDYRRARAALSYRYRYRPYLVGDYPDYTRLDLREGAVRRWLRRHTASYHAFELGLARLRGEADEYLGRPPTDAAGLRSSEFYDFDEHGFALLRATLERLADAAAPRPLALALLPVEQDFLRRAQSGDAPLATRLEEALAGSGIVVVDLLAEMATRVAQPAELFFRCDYHWNERGHALAARILEERLGLSAAAPEHAEPDAHRGDQRERSGADRDAAGAAVGVAAR